MNLTCIVCPMGCALSIQKAENGFTVTGNQCPRGITYAITECTAPTRTLTTILPVEGEEMVSVKSAEPLPKEKIFDCIRVLSKMTLNAPIKIGDVIVHDILGTGIDIVATKNIP